MDTDTSIVTDIIDRDCAVRTVYSSDQKMFGACLEVHLDNLISPDPKRLVRELSYQHVDFLEKSFQQNSGQIHLLVGLLEKEINPQALKESGTTKVEVIGGNHSRVALQSLLKKGLLTSPLVKVKMYRDLTDIEALQIGVQHNEVLKKSRELSFMEKVKLIRQLKPEVETSESIDQWKIRLATIFSYKGKSQVRNNLKNHLALSKVCTELWESLVMVDEKWNSGAIKDIPKSKTTITQTFYIKFMRLHDVECQKELLTILLREGYKAFVTKLNEASTLQQKGDREDGDKEVESSDTTSRADRRVQEMKVLVEKLMKKNHELMKENEHLKKENQELKSSAREMAAQMDTMEDFNEERIDEVDEQSDYERTESGDEEECDVSSSRRKRKNISDSDVSDVSESKQKRQKREKNVYEEGEEVLALWKDRYMEGWYKAKILSRDSKGYCILYEDGVKKTVNQTWLKRC